MINEIIINIIAVLFTVICLLILVFWPFLFIFSNRSSQINKKDNIKIRKSLNLRIAFDGERYWLEELIGKQYKYCTYLYADNGLCRNGDKPKYFDSIDTVNEFAEKWREKYDTNANKKNIFYTRFGD